MDRGTTPTPPSYPEPQLEQVNNERVGTEADVTSEHVHRTGLTSHNPHVMTDQSHEQTGKEIQMNWNQVEDT